MGVSRILIILGMAVVTTGAITPHLGDWGFYAHRLINRMAVYTLPPAMMELYKPHIDYISEHAVDPDKRRYATPFEAMRHYIDLEPWGQFPFEKLPRSWWQAVMRHTDLLWIQDQKDSILLEGANIWQQFMTQKPLQLALQGEVLTISAQELRALYQEEILPRFYDEPWAISCSDLMQRFEMSEPPCVELQVVDSLTQHGILPYYLVEAQNLLRLAFIDQDLGKILRYSAEIGHYIGDAHVPLHTSENYNGQLTDQIGIHAFWESRIPELFAEAEYDFLVGKPTYISDAVTYYWDIVLTSHTFVDSVLSIEKELSSRFPQDRQFCFDERLEQTVRIQCREYARAYQNRMSGMVESRMQAAIRSIASAWYTAWIDAGQPRLQLTNSPVVDSVDTGSQVNDGLIGRRFGKKRRHE